MLFQLMMVLLTMFGSDVTPSQNFELKCYPEKLQIGDTFYVLVIYHNKTDEIEKQPVPSWIHLAFINQQGKKWMQIFETDFKYIFTIPPPPPNAVQCLPNSSTCLYATSFSLPSLEDLYQSDFWDELNGKENDNLDEYPLDFEFEFNSFKKNEFGAFLLPSPKPITLQQKVIMTRRSESENTLLKLWYENTPKEYFPKLSKTETGINEYRYISYVKRTPQYPTLNSQGYSRQKILNHDFKHFIRVGNRYPGDPNAPGTWQGWKELEDSLTSSTMKDEIRLTRIIIQYCDTEDQKILDELKEWFGGLNEIQRICMAKSILDRMYFCEEIMAPEEAKNLIPPYRNLFNTIREYDVVANQKDFEQILQQLGLLE